MKPCASFRLQFVTLDYEVYQNEESHERPCESERRGFIQRQPTLRKVESRFCTLEPKLLLQLLLQLLLLLLDCTSKTYFDDSPGH